VAAVAKREKDPERASRLLALVEDQGWEKTHLARTIGADPSRVHGWLAGEPISSEHIEGLARALETTRLYIMSGDGPKYRPTMVARLDPLDLARAAEHLETARQPPEETPPSTKTPEEDD
jgi:hypothetical protein